MWTIALVAVVAWLILRKPAGPRGVFFIPDPPHPVDRSHLPPGDLRHTLSR